MEDRNQGGKTLRRHFRRVPADLDRVVVVGGVDDDAVGLAVTSGPAEGAGEFDVQLRDVSSAQLVRGDAVGAAEGFEVDDFDASRVHGDRARSVEEPE